MTQLRVVIENQYVTGTVFGENGLQHLVVVGAEADWHGVPQGTDPRKSRIDVQLVREREILHQGGVPREPDARRRERLETAD